jgi:phage terminase small subunit
VPRKRDPKRDEALEIYKKHDGNITNREIAKILGVDEKKVAVWKQRDKWNVVQQTKSNVVQQKKNPAKKARSPNKKESEKPIVESDELTEKQRLFCLYYVKYFNATKAYQKAYECDYFTAKTNGSRMLTNANIKAEIDRMKKEIADGLMLDATAVLQKYIDIAFADITDFVEHGQEEYEEYDEITGEKITKKRNYVRFKNSDEVDGTIITEVKQGREGVSIKLADKMKALDKLAQYFDLFPDKFKRRIEEEKLKLAQQQKQQVEVETPIFVDDVDEED